MPAQALDTAWERRTLRNARILAAVALAVLSLLAWALHTAGLSLGVGLSIAAGLTAGLYLLQTASLRRRRRIMSEPFPPEWEEVLQRDVVFFRALDEEGRRRFRRELQVFLGEKRITGIKLELDTTTRVLAAASAVIPIFGFPEWEWDTINEVLVYPDRFDRDFRFGPGGDRHTLGMVGTGAMNRLMILSRPDLVAGFKNARDRRNVGLHEFAHLVDKADGSIDGVPEAGLPRDAVRPWIELVRRKMAEIERGDSDIDPYALTNEAEFFAVTAEYFFERPGIMQRKHPELFAMLSRIFNQSPTERLAAYTRELRRGRPRFGRNSPCPCGSGRKYKKCCLRRSRRAAT